MSAESVCFGLTIQQGSAASNIWFDFTLPVAEKNASKESSQQEVSRSIDRTFECSTPRFLWTPAHLMQIKIPRLIDTQSAGDFPQSAQAELVGRRASSRIVEAPERIEIELRDWEPRLLIFWEEKELV